MKTNYINNYKKETENNQVVETSMVVKENPNKEDVVLLVGTVVNCDFLNIRKEPSIQSEVLKIVPRGTKLDVVSDYTNDSFYKIKWLEVTNIITEEDKFITGYCIKTFLEVSRSDE